ncbi:putative membrane protein YhdT [Halarchaeum rubridurum]|uniref:Putative membrane protein YhdT n=1 Tax=Halarchaeum rubridurum TaxID=489911 RepID=A0A830FRJ9_9EURY|nr:hypothetical protein [Halarchaeum rubridurum]MBP1953511.1 putative membrane protein YhdT [Halarchaeum rubridurum]GGM64652.1 hypothetical protein GCM10009017_13470 [Halarchaeum rubridurum]
MTLIALPLAAVGAGSLLPLLLLVVQLAIAYLVYRDAKRRHSRHALAWALGAFFGNLVVWVLYYVVRDEVGR